MRTLLLLLVTPLVLTVEAATHVVRNGASLAAAIARCAENDTVLLKSGTYAEGTITIARPMVLRGEGWPVIDGGGRGEVILVKASNVTISGVEVRGTRVSDMNDNAAIKCSDGTNITLRNNRVIGCFFGIYLSGVEHALVSHNRVIGDAAVQENRRANGIHLWKCSDIRIEHNTVMHHRDGIYLEFVTDSQVANDSSAFNLRYGLHFMFSHRDSYTHNVFHDNGAGVAVMFTREVTMTDNRFLHNKGTSAYGLLLKEINDAVIERNTFVDNTVGLLVDGCNRALVKDNTYTGNGWGVKLYANSSATFKGNTFGGNTFDLATNGDLLLSTLNGNSWDRYRGYDLDHDGLGDVPHRPLSVFGLVTERMPYAMVLSRSLMVNLLDQAERVVPTMTPAGLEDTAPLMRPPEKANLTVMRVLGCEGENGQARTEAGAVRRPCYASTSTVFTVHTRTLFRLYLFVNCIAFFTCALSNG
ncbi:MAG: nitrous oxide reductase family maturation protein NosD [Flavobacteriales bacterium]|nr:nitrous oxide reductase family maturation protein NosD [Flavobacteriales bacterium]